MYVFILINEDIIFLKSSISFIYLNKNTIHKHKFIKKFEADELMTFDKEFAKWQDS